MYTRVCKACDQEFNSYKKDASTCYMCTLKWVTGGGWPEEGDFNTAALVSGTLSPHEERELMRELEAIDHADAEVRWSEQQEYYDSFIKCRRCGDYLDWCDCDKRDRD